MCNYKGEFVSRAGSQARTIGHEYDLYPAAVCIINDPKFVALFGHLSYLHYYYIHRDDDDDDDVVVVCSSSDRWTLKSRCAFRMVGLSGTGRYNGHTNCVCDSQRKLRDLEH